MKIIQSEKTGIYSVRFKTRSGKSVTRNLGTTNKKEAVMLVKEAKIEELETAARINALTKDAISSIVADRNILFQDCIHEWVKFSKVRSKSGNTMYTQSGLHNNFAESMGIKHISQVTEKHVSDWINEPNDNVSLNARKQRLAALRSLFSYALANSYIMKDPTAVAVVDASKLNHKQKETKVKKPFTTKEYNKMIKHAPDFMGHAIKLGWWTGLRIVDISKLEWESWSDTHLTVWTEKQDKRVMLPLDNPMIGGGVLKELLTEIKLEDKKYCFPKWAELADDPKRRSRFSVYFNRFLERMEIPDKSFHCFRHSFVTRTKMDFDSSLEMIAQWVGHSQTKTTEGYLHDA